MPEFFQRMGETFARNPAGGFQELVTELGQIDEQALRGINVTFDEERRAGLETREKFLKAAREKGYEVIHRAADERYLGELVEGLRQHMEHRERYAKLDVTLVDCPIADGMCFPGGFLVFTTGLLDEPDEATVAGVVAHELGHLDRGHMYDHVRRGKLAEQTYGRAPGFDIRFDEFFSRQIALFGLMMNPFRPEQEHEADCDAATWLYLDGYDPNALVRFFERMHRRQQDQPDSPFFAFGRSHPYSLDRGAHVEARFKQLRRWKPRVELGLYPKNLRKRSSHFADGRQAEAAGRD